MGVAVGWVGHNESRWNIWRPQETEHPEWKSKLSLVALSWSQMLKSNMGKKGCWEAVQEHSVSVEKSNQMQQDWDLLCSERWKAQLPGHTRRLKMLKFKLSIWVRGVGSLRALSELAQVAWAALESSFESSPFNSGQSGLTRRPGIEAWQELPVLSAKVGLCFSPSHHFPLERKGSSRGKLKQR